MSAWCGRRDSNPHNFRHWNLNPARLPVPPRPLNSIMSGRDAAGGGLIACGRPFAAKKWPVWASEPNRRNWTSHLKNGPHRPHGKSDFPAEPARTDGRLGAAALGPVLAAGRDGAGAAAGGPPGQGRRAAPAPGSPGYAGLVARGARAAVQPRRTLEVSSRTTCRSPRSSTGAGIDGAACRRTAGRPPRRSPPGPGKRSDSIAPCRDLPVRPPLARRRPGACRPGPGPLVVRKASPSRSTATRCF